MTLEARGIFAFVSEDEMAKPDFPIRHNPFSWKQSFCQGLAARNKRLWRGRSKVGRSLARHVAAVKNRICISIVSRASACRWTVMHSGASAVLQSQSPLTLLSCRCRYWSSIHLLWSWSRRHGRLTCVVLLRHCVSVGPEQLCFSRGSTFTVATSCCWRLGPMYNCAREGCNGGNGP